MFGPIRGSVFRCSVPFEVRSFDVRSFSTFGLSRFGLSSFGHSRFGHSRFGHGFLLANEQTLLFQLPTPSLHTHRHKVGSALTLGGVPRISSLHMCRYISYFNRATIIKNFLIIPETPTSLRRRLDYRSDGLGHVLEGWVHHHGFLLRQVPTGGRNRHESIQQIYITIEHVRDKCRLGTKC